MTTSITVSVTRTIDAPCDKVWRADTEPRHFERWFGAKAGSARTDLRTGGAWSAVVGGEGEEIQLEGHYVEVVEHRRVVMTVPNGPETLEVAVDFTDLGDGRTEVTSSTRVAAEAREIVEQTAGAILDEIAKIAESL
ncbi:SRPBCC domain-containing protein [Catenulispora subtropica]|uniref:SRPBCC domain-containing protein n=1 Tax=Catenulispora subtropica TaxID=450798 RepID=A0ABN2QE05_9ACTN